jgi:hypothetical protein
MKVGDSKTVLYGRASVSGKIVHIEGKSAIMKVEKSTDHNVVAPGQTVIVSVPVK